MLVYIEYISRRPGVSLEAFHEVAGRGQTGWAGEYGDDQLVLNVGRTWRIGPEPEYVAVWYNAAAGLERIARLGADLHLGRGRAFRRAVQARGPDRRRGLLRAPARARCRAAAARTTPSSSSPRRTPPATRSASFFEERRSASGPRAQPARRAHRSAGARSVRPGRLDPPLLRRPGDGRPRARRRGRARPPRERSALRGSRRRDLCETVRTRSSRSASSAPATSSRPTSRCSTGSSRAGRRARGSSALAAGRRGTACSPAGPD